jgi:Cys-rich protein (TIGR01571 family)
MPRAEEAPQVVYGAAAVATPAPGPFPNAPPVGPPVGGAPPYQQYQQYQQQLLPKNTNQIVVLIGNDGSLFGCFDDIGICCFGLWCSPCLAGQNHQRAKIDNRCMVPAFYVAGFALNALVLVTGIPLGLPFIIGGCYHNIMRRGMIQQMFLGKQDPDINNCLIYTFCAACATCQVRAIHCTANLRLVCMY